MKKACWLVCICLAPAINLNAQINPVYQAFQVEIAGGLAMLNTGSTGGVVKINPAYTIAGRYKVGVQMEGVGYCNTTTCSSILTLDYYFITRPAFRLSAGGGYGIYNSSLFGQSSKIPEESGSQWTSGKRGGTLRMGFQWHHMSLEMAYNFVPTLYVSNSIIGYPTITETYKNGFFGLTLGIMVGGGKK